MSRRKVLKISEPLPADGIRICFMEERAIPDRDLCLYRVYMFFSAQSNSDAYVADSSTRNPFIHHTLDVKLQCVDTVSWDKSSERALS